MSNDKIHDNNASGDQLISFAVCEGGRSGGSRFISTVSRQFLHIGVFADGGKAGLTTGLPVPLLRLRPRPRSRPRPPSSNSKPEILEQVSEPFPENGFLHHQLLAVVRTNSIVTVNVESG